MSTAPDDRLLRLAEVLADGQAIHWDEVLRQDPDLAPALERFRQLQAIASAHETSSREQGEETWRVPIKPLKTPLFLWGEIQVFEKLGEGAYAEVYRAWDPALEREVALKLSRSDAGLSATGVQRWVDEARRLARVRHPNVLVVHGVDMREGRAGFWTDLIHGQTLEQVLKDHGWLGGAEATLVGLDLCKALAAVHAVGLVHGDLKSSNVMREGGAGGATGTGAGRIVLADFGASIESSPTISRSAAFATPLTCAPEVLRGEPPTPASDLYSLGVLLYRLVAGRYPIESTDPTELETRIQYGLRTPLRDLRPDLGTALVAAVERALDPDPQRRFSSAGQMERALGEALSVERSAGQPSLRRDGVVGEPVPRVRSRRRRWLGIATVSVAVAMVALAWIAIERIMKRPSPSILFNIHSPAGKVLRVDPNHFAISPDGTTLAFIAHDSTSQTLWVRRLGDLQQRELPGTSGAGQPFWSPDSRQIGFFADGMMKRVGLGGEDPQVICAVPYSRGAAWSRKGVIVFSSGDGPLSRVLAAGGTPETVTQVDTTGGVRDHVWPSFLPDGEHFIYVARRKESFESGEPPTRGPWTSYVGSIRSMRAESLLTADGAPMYAAPGHLIFKREGALFAQSFDTRRRRLTGRPRQIAHSSGAVAFFGSRCGSVSTNGVLAWTASLSSMGGGRTRLVWIDRNGARIRDVDVPHDRWTTARISPDGRHAILRKNEHNGDSNLWLLDLERETLRSLTQGPGLKVFGVWSPDSKEILYSLRGSGGVFDLRRITLDRSDSDRLFYRSRGELQNAHGWSPDGKVLAEGTGNGTGLDLLVVPAQGGASRPYLATRFNERGAEISPDGKWVVYLSNESRARLDGKDWGNSGVLAFVQSFPKPGKRQNVSTEPLFYVRWSRQGREILLFAQDFRIRSVPVEGAEELRLGKAQELFSLPSNIKWLAPAPDGERFLLLEPDERLTAGRSIQVTANWMAGLGP